MEGILNLTSICRCCHNTVDFESLNSNYLAVGGVMNYNNILEDTFGIKLYSPSFDVSYMICNKCKSGLQSAYFFKQHVLVCEEKFKEYCKNEEISKTNANQIQIKVEENIDDDHFQSYDDRQMPDDINSKYERKAILQENFKSEEPGGSTVRKKKIKAETTRKEKRKIKKTAVKKRNRKPGEQSVPHLKLAHKYDKNLIVQEKTEKGVTFSCRECGTSYTNKNSLLSHLASFHVGEHKCPMCNELFATGYKLRKHYMKHFPSKQHRCKVCGLTYPSKYYLRVHFETKHKKRVRLHMCDICFKAFVSPKTLKLHKHLHTEGRSKKLCDVCGMGFNDVTNLRSHKQTVHLKLRPFICDHCNAAYKTKKNLKTHIILKHLPVNGLKCSVCYKIFATKDGLKQHEAIHTRKFVCCNIEFEGKGAYISHVRKCKNRLNSNDAVATHKYPKLNTMPVPCDTCGKLFATKFTLRRHMEHQHAEESKRVYHNCDICDQKFIDDDNVMRHKLKVHVPRILNYSKAKCNICKRKYNNLERHMLAHADTPFRCNFCQKGFTEAGTLNRHMKYVHSGDRAFKCEFCNKSYKAKGALMFHQEKFHDGKNKVDCDGYMSTYIITKSADCQ